MTLVYATVNKSMFHDKVKLNRIHPTYSDVYTLYLFTVLYLGVKMQAQLQLFDVHANNIEIHTHYKTKIHAGRLFGIHHITHCS